MSLQPFYEASVAIQVHIVAALAAAFLGAVIFLRPKGSPLHKVLGRVFFVAMALTALSSFLIHTIRLIGPWSPIHLLSVYVLVSLGYALHAIRKGNVEGHKRTMMSLYLSGIVIAGGFTFLPGRIMHDIVFGTRTDAEFPIGALFLILAVAVVGGAAIRSISKARLGQSRF